MLSSFKIGSNYYLGWLTWNSQFPCLILPSDDIIVYVVTPGRSLIFAQLQAQSSVGPQENCEHWDTCGMLAMPDQWRVQGKASLHRNPFCLLKVAPKFQEDWKWLEAKKLAAPFWLHSPFQSSVTYSRTEVPVRRMGRANSSNFVLFL